MKRKKKRVVSMADEILADIGKVAHKMNVNSLDYRTYRENGGKYLENEIYEHIGSFACALELCGLKVTV